MALVEKPLPWLITSRVEASEDEKNTRGSLQKGVY